MYLEKDKLAMLETMRHSALHKTSTKKRRKKQAEAASSEEESDVEEPVEEPAQESNGATQNKRQPVKNSQAVSKRLEDIKLDLPFVETLCVVAEEELDVPDVEDDLRRELEFYNQALRAVKRGRSQLDEAGVVHMRPIDYFAEMVKSDEHMGRVKQQLLFEKQKMEAFEKRKQQKEYKKYAKQVQAEKQKQKAEKKRKSKDIAEEFKSKPSGNVRKPSTVSRKRSAIDKKFGFGGKKKGKKRNDAQSTNDTSGFSVKKNKAAFPGMRSKHRPGKSKRQRR